MPRRTTTERSGMSLKLPPSEAREAIEALHEGEADALIVRTPRGEDVYTLESVNKPYRLFVEQMQEGAVTVCSDRSILYCNKRFADMVGGIVENVLGRYLDEFIAEESQQAYRSLHEHGCEETARGECTLISADGSPLPVQLTFSPLRPRRSGHCCVIITDRSYVQRHEEMSTAMASAEAANFAKDQFLAMLSHELRTPLSAVLGWAQMLRKGTLSKEDAQRGLEAIERNARAQMQLISDLLDVSRITSGKLRLDMKPIDLAEVASNAVEAVAPAAKEKGIELTASIDERAGHVNGDANRLQQAILNLLNNAVKFTPPGGSARLELKRINHHVELIVSDTGQGVSPQFLPYIFDRFQQAQSQGRQNPGLGLGLFIAKQVIEMHGGNISASSEGPGKGATFTIRMPLVAVGMAQPPRKREHMEMEDEASQPIRLDGVRLLVVDDVEDSLAMIAVALRQAGATVTTASSAEDARKAIRESSPDVLISDLDMPEENGFEFVRHLRHEGHTGRDLPAIALTAMARPEDRRRAMLAGYQLHVAKPVDHDELIAAVAGVSAMSAATAG